MSSYRSRIIETVVPYIFIVAVFYVMGLSIALTIKAGLGVGPWNVFHLGLVNHLPITVGQASQGVGLIVVLIALFLGIRPTLATLLNMLLVGYFIDINLIYLLSQVTIGDSLVFRLVVLLLGIALLGMSSGAYISTHLGAGPRDGLVLGLSRKTGLSVGAVRTLVEVTVLAVGYFLGGPVGIGTVIFSLTVGWIMQFSLKLFGVLRQHPSLTILFNNREKDRCRATA